MSTMPVLAHLRELRHRLIISVIAWLLGSVVAFFAFPWIIDLLVEPMSKLMFPGDQKLYITSFFEGFGTKMKMSMLSGFIVSFPVHVYGALRFMFPGLKKREKRIILGTLLASFGLVCLSFYLSYFTIIPFSLQFLMGAGFVPEQVGVLLHYNQNLFYVFNFIVYCLLFFQFPVILELLMIMGVVNRPALFRASKYVVIGIFVVSALVTPPDIVSQVSIAGPLVILYFLAIGVAKVCRFGE